MGLHDEEPIPGSAAVAARIREAHGLDDAGMTRAIEVALTRCGFSHGEAGPLAALGLDHVLSRTTFDGGRLTMEERHELDALLACAEGQRGYEALSDEAHARVCALYEKGQVA